MSRKAGHLQLNKRKRQVLDAPALLSLKEIHTDRQHEADKHSCK